MFEELEPTKKPKAPRNLDDFSVAELQEYITNLQQEIIRAEAEIAKKESSRTAAESVFKS